jgi:lysophospholipase L1-like esterase
MVKTRVLAIVLLVSAGSVRAEDGRDGSHHKWVASWATSPSTYFIYTPPPQPLNVASFPLPVGTPIQYTVANVQPDLVFPFPNATGAAGASAVNQTFRSMVKPDLWGRNIRIRFSNFFGNKPVTFDHVTVGLQEFSANIVKGTLTPVTFGGGSSSVTIAPGERVFSDAVHLSWVSSADDRGVQGRNLAVSYSVKGDSGRMTYHPGANQTSFITAQGSGDHTADLDAFAYQFTTTSWFFVETVDVQAPEGTVVVCAFGDSITDGTHTTLNVNDRWMNVLSRRLHNAYGNHVSIVNEAIGGNRVVNPVAMNANNDAPSTSGPAATDRLDRDVLGLSGLTHVIWLEGINDLGALHLTHDIIDGYQKVASHLHDAGVKVYAGTLTSALGVYNTAFPTVDNGPTADAGRLVLNSFIRQGGTFDGFEDFDKATLDQATGNMKTVFLPNSQFTQLPWDYLHPNHAGYDAMGLAVDIAPFAPEHHDH